MSYEIVNKKMQCTQVEIVYNYETQKYGPGKVAELRVAGESFQLSDVPGDALEVGVWYDVSITVQESAVQKAPRGKVISRGHQHKRHRK